MIYLNKYFNIEIELLYKELLIIDGYQRIMLYQL